MLLYEYKCPKGHVLLKTERQEDTWCVCTAPAIDNPDIWCVERATRRFSFSIAKSMPEHFNPSVGQYVTNKQSFTDALKRKSESATLATGIEQTFQPVDLRTDPSSFGVTDEGLYETEKHQHDLSSS